MSDSFEYEFVAPRVQLPVLLQALGECLVEEDRQRLRAALLLPESVPPTTAAERAQAAPGVLLLTLSLAPDAAVQVFARAYPEFAQPEAGRVQCGYVECRWGLDATTVTLSLWSTSHALAQVLRESTTLRAALLAMATTADAALYSMDEWGERCVILARA